MGIFCGYRSESSPSGEDWALPDQLVFSTVSALLSLASTHKEHRATVMDAIYSFSLKVVQQLETETREFPYAEAARL
jgi:phosphatidylinositol 4-kinase